MHSDLWKECEVHIGSGLSFMLTEPGIRRKNFYRSILLIEAHQYRDRDVMLYTSAYKMYSLLVRHYVTAAVALLISLLYAQINSFYVCCVLSFIRSKLLSRKY